MKLTTCMKAPGNWCPLGVLLEATLLHCRMSTNLPDLSLMKSKSSLRMVLISNMSPKRSPVACSFCANCSLLAGPLSMTAV